MKNCNEVADRIQRISDQIHNANPEVVISLDKRMRPFTQALNKAIRQRGFSEVIPVNAGREKAAILKANAVHSLEGAKLAFGQPSWDELEMLITRGGQIAPASAAVVDELKETGASREAVDQILGLCGVDRVEHFTIFTDRKDMQGLGYSLRPVDLGVVDISERSFQSLEFQTPRSLQMSEELVNALK